MATDPGGIDKIYEDAAARNRRSRMNAVAAIRNAMGQPSEPSYSFFDELVKVIRQGQPLALPGVAELRLEDGTIRQVRDRLPADAPIGYHDLTPKKRVGCLGATHCEPGALSPA